MRQCRHAEMKIPFVLLAIATFFAGCHSPTAEDRNNRRVLDELLTAITLKNSRLLEESAARAKVRHEAGQFADVDYDEIEAFIGKAREKDWPAAEAAGYAFRRKRPYVVSGQ